MVPPPPPPPRGQSWIPVALLLLWASLHQLTGVLPLALAQRIACTKTCDLFSQECLNGGCVCKRNCPRSTLRVCTSKGFEYVSRCHFFRDQCLCKGESSLCRNPGVESDYILMYSACRGRGPNDARFAASERSPALVERQCSNYNNRLAVWLNYALALKLSESPLTMEAYETDEYLYGLYTNELLMYAPLRREERLMAEKLAYYPMERFQFDSRLLVVWFCILDTNTDGWLDEMELAQLIRVLLPHDGCIEEFLNRCRRRSASIGVGAWQGSDCFGLPKGDIRLSCDL